MGSRGHAYLIQTRGMEAVLAGLAGFIREVPVHGTDKPANTYREHP